MRGPEANQFRRGNGELWEDRTISLCASKGTSLGVEARRRRVYAAGDWGICRVDPGRKLKEGGSADRGLGGEEQQHRQSRAEAQRGARGRRASAGPQSAGEGGGGSAGGREEGEAGPARPAEAAGSSARAGPAHNTSHVCATHPPPAQSGGRGGRERGRGERRGGGRGPGVWGRNAARRADAGGGARGGACAGAGPVAGAGAGNGAQGPVLLAACLGCLFTPGGGALTRGAGGREGKRGAAAPGRWSRSGRRRGPGRCVPGRSG
nr:spidroin-1-like [Equus asinus]